MIAPLLQSFIQILKTVIRTYFVIHCKTAIFVTHPLLIFGIDEHLEHIDKKTGVNDGRVVREHLFVQRGEGACFFLLRSPPCFGALLSPLD